MNTWLDGSYSPVHKHNKHSETFVILSGALAFFTFGHEEDKGTPKCHILGPESRMRGIAVEAGEWHAMTAAPKSLGYPGESKSRSPRILHDTSPSHAQARSCKDERAVLLLSKTV